MPRKRTSLPRWSDNKCANFLEALDNSDDIEVTNWEAGFIEDNLGVDSFTPAQKTVIGRMIEKYGHKLKGW